MKTYFVCSECKKIVVEIAAIGLFGDAKPEDITEEIIAAVFDPYITGETIYLCPKCLEKELIDKN